MSAEGQFTSPGYVLHFESALKLRRRLFPDATSFGKANSSRLESWWSLRLAITASVS